MKSDLIRARDALESGQPDRAVSLLEAHLRASPNDTVALVLRAFTSIGKNDAVDAARWLQSALDSAPDRWDVHHDVGAAFLRLGRADDALRCFEDAARRNPSSVEVQVALGRLRLDHRKEPSAAAKAFLRALKREPDHLDARYHLGKALFQLGDVDRAIAEFRRAKALAGKLGRDDVKALCLQSIAVAIPGSPAADNARILADRAAWARLQEPAQRPAPPFPGRDRSPERPLTIGYVSSFFGHENWMKPVWGLINRHSRDAFQVRIFSFGQVPGAEGPEKPGETAFRPQESDRIFDVSGVGNERIAVLIEEEAVGDVLVDLNGFSDLPRLRLFMLRPAPVIAGWFNMYATTALSCFDYMIGDRHVVLPGEEVHYSERIVRVPGSYLTFEVGYPVPPVAATPYASSGRVTFGSLCSRYKITPHVIRAWGEILRRCPQSRLILRSGGLEAENEREHLFGEFDRHGIGPARIELLGRAPHFRFLETYDRIDIALDTFPYSGGTTTTEAIWQGVPVVSFAGPTWASRTSATILQEGGLGDWVAEDLEGYIELAVRWGNDRNAGTLLAALRSSMRERLGRSSVCDTAGFARAMESLYRDMWRAWCRGAAE